MGGEAEYKMPHKVWRPLGGNNPPNWRRNTAIIMLTLVPASFYWVFTASAERERRPKAPLKPIPSQRWAKYTSVDDPDYEAKLERQRELNAKHPPWTRLVSEGHK